MCLLKGLEGRRALSQRLLGLLVAAIAIVEQGKGGDFRAGNEDIDFALTLLMWRVFGHLGPGPDWLALVAHHLDSDDVACGGTLCGCVHPTVGGTGVRFFFATLRGEIYIGKMDHSSFIADPPAIAELATRCATTRVYLTHICRRPMLRS